MIHGRIVALAAVAAVTFCVGTAAAPPAADAAYKWHKQTVRYYSVSRDERVVKTLAVSAGLWNELGVKVKLVRTKSSRKADIRVMLRKQSFFATPFIMGTGQLPGGPRPSALNLSRNLFFATAKTDPAQTEAVAVVVHEFGHTLGLNHRNGCSIMRPSAGDACGTGVGDGDRLQCGPAKADYSMMRKKYGKRRGGGPNLYTCSGAFRKYNWVPSIPEIASPVEWSVDGVNWSRDPGTVPLGSTVILRHAVSDANVVFPRYVQMAQDMFGGGYTGSATFASGCIARTPAGQAPNGQTACATVENTGYNGYKEFQVRLDRSGQRYWLVARYVMDQPSTTVTFNAGVAMYFLPEAQRTKSAGSVSLSTP